MEGVCGGWKICDFAPERRGKLPWSCRCSKLNAPGIEGRGDVDTGYAIIVNFIYCVLCMVY